MGRLDTVTHWVPPPPDMTLPMSLSQGGNISGPWATKVQIAEHHLHVEYIYVQKLWTVRFTLQREHSIRLILILALPHNLVEIHCLNWEGSSRSPALLRELESVFKLAKDRSVHITASRLAGESNWADFLSIQTSSSIGRNKNSNLRHWQPNFRDQRWISLHLQVIDNSQYLSLKYQGQN